MRARRALLYMPGDDMHKIQKAAALEADCACMDIEDGVAINRKESARQTIVEALGKLDFGRSERLVRINPVGSGWEDQDLQAAVQLKTDGVVLPKVENGEDLRWISSRITAIERRRGWSPGGIGLIAIVETARGIVNLKEIAAADARLQALIFGAEDFAGDIGAQRTHQSWEVFYARSAVVTHARAFGLQAIDMVYVDFHDLKGLQAEARQGAEMGFEGKQVIHPNQIQVVQAAFTPTEEAIRSATRILEAHEAHQHQGIGAFALDGKMVDAPVVKAAQQVLAKARAAGKLP